MAVAAGRSVLTLKGIHLKEARWLTGCIVEADTLHTSVYAAVSLTVIGREAMLNHGYFSMREIFRKRRLPGRSCLKF